MFRTVYQNHCLWKVNWNHPIFKLLILIESESANSVRRFFKNSLRHRKETVFLIESKLKLELEEETASELQGK